MKCIILVIDYLVLPCTQAEYEKANATFFVKCINPMFDYLLLPWMQTEREKAHAAS